MSLTPPASQASAEKKAAAHSSLLIGAGILIGIYFFCPFVYVLPFVAAVKLGLMSPDNLQRVDVLFRPVEWLSQNVPAYGKLLETEARLVPASLFEGPK